MLRRRTEDSRTSRSNEQPQKSRSHRQIAGSFLVAAMLVAVLTVVVADGTLIVGGHTFEYLGVAYNDDGTSTWTYRVTSGTKPSLSHWVLEFDPSLGEENVVEASEEKIGNVVDQILLYCYRYDPQLGRYTAVAMRILRIAGVVFLLALAVFLFFMLRHDKARRPAAQTT